MRTFVPKKGGFIAVTFDPQSGYEQKECRPALVVSNTLFNERIGLSIVCPLTSADRGYPFHVPVTEGLQVKGFVMVEQVKSIDYRASQAKTVGKASDDLLDQVLSILDACIY